MAELGSAPANRMCVVPERTKLQIAMTIFQFGYAGNHVILRAALNMGISKLVFPVYRNIIAVLLLAPVAYFLEKYVVKLNSKCFHEIFIAFLCCFFFFMQERQASPECYFSYTILHSWICWVRSVN